VRLHLVEQLNQGLLLGHKLTLVSAPAGFGKSTLVREWVGSIRYVVYNTDFGRLLTNTIKSIGSELAGIAIGVALIDYLNERRLDEQLKIQLIRNMASHNNSVADIAISELAERGWLQDGSLVGKRFRGANWTKSNLRDADLRDADLTGAKLRETNLGNAQLDDAILVDVHLKKSFWAGASLENCNLTGSRLQDSDIRRAVLRGAILRQANLSRAYLNGANLEGADLYRTKLLHIEPGRSLTLEQLKSAKRTFGAVMQDGTKLRDIDGDEEKPTFSDWVEKQDPENWYPMKRSTRR
jgi:uncharacterized protein YjbI with pentapeptide repeats